MRDSVVSTFRVQDAGNGNGLTVVVDRVSQLDEVFATCFREPHSRGETIVYSDGVYLSKMQPSWNLE